MTTITNKYPKAVDGIFYQISDDGWLYCNVHDMAENKNLRFVGEEATETGLTPADIEAAETYRDEMNEMFSEE